VPAQRHDLEFLRHARVGRLATASPAGEPHVIPICFVLDGSTIYSAIDAKPKRVAPRRLRRLQNIAANPRTMLLVDDYDEDWSRLRYVQASGRADVLDSGPERERALELLREKYPQYRTMPGFPASLVIRLEVERVVRWPDAPVQ
jgi:PPOX class probable F420-dependent enzyme